MLDGNLVNIVTIGNNQLRVLVQVTHILILIIASLP
jgi:hypothetical protein